MHAVFRNGCHRYNSVCGVSSLLGPPREKKSSLGRESLKAESSLQAICALQVGGLLWCLQNSRDFWDATCSVRLLTSNKCLPPPLWTDCTAACASTFQPMYGRCWSQELFLQHHFQVKVLGCSFILGISCGLYVVSVTSGPLSFRRESKDELWELWRWAVEWNRCARVCWCFLQVNAITVDKTSQWKFNASSLS